MKYIRGLQILLVLLSSPARSLVWLDLMPGPHQPPAGQALLRCDPGLMVMSIDGDKSRRVNNGRGRFDCAILLTPGSHTVGLRVEWSYSENIFMVTEGTLEPDTFPFDVSANRIYRLKYVFGKTISYWLQDVTEEEANPQFHEFVGKTPNRKLPKPERMSYVVVRILPSDVALIAKTGSTHGIWFLPHKRHVYQAKDAEEFVVKQVPAGTNLALTLAVTEGESWGTGRLTADVCGDTRFRLFEDLPGGKVFFLGTYRFKPIMIGMELSFDQNDMEAAAEFLRRVHPQIADNLEPAPFRLARLRYPCLPTNHQQLVNAAIP